mmetsp:Transcript_3698/g.7758  ORF Transcript_3698/g.7758 Transcript_3698/m.7758 type:complete len:285 (-) Transcript_3698:261-1115(-)
MRPTTQCSNYCSRECQRDHWPVHKRVCPAQTAFMDGFMPSATTQRTVEEAKKVAPPDAEVPGAAEFDEGLCLIAGRVGVLEAYPNISAAEKGPLDPEQGHRLILEAAGIGHKGAQYQAALSYLPNGYLFKSVGTNEANSQSIRWIRAAAESGHAEAQITYGNKLWREGMLRHPTDNYKALIWIRRALAKGVVVHRGPDVHGHALSEKSFEGGLRVANEAARKLFLYEASPILHDGDLEDWEEKVWLCAESGVGAAMTSVAGFTKENNTSINNTECIAITSASKS